MRINRWMKDDVSLNHAISPKSEIVYCNPLRIRYIWQPNRFIRRVSSLPISRLTHSTASSHSHTNYGCHFFSSIQYRKRWFHSREMISCLFLCYLAIEDRRQSYCRLGTLQQLNAKEFLILEQSLLFQGALQHCGIWHLSRASLLQRRHRFYHI